MLLYGKGEHLHANGKGDLFFIKRSDDAELKAMVPLYCMNLSDIN